MNYLLELKTNHLHTPQAVFCTDKCNTMSWGIPAVEGNGSKSRQLGCLGVSKLHCADFAHTITSLFILYRIACCWQWHARFSLGWPHMTWNTLQWQVLTLPWHNDTYWGWENRLWRCFVLHLELGVMIHSWRLVILGWQNQLPLAKFFLGVGVGKFVPAICWVRQRI